MRRLLFFFAILTFSLEMAAQSVLSFGLRGGLDFMLPKSEQSTRSKLGLGGAFDFGYTLYWPIGYVDWGFHTGISIGYASNESQISFTLQYTNYDYMANEMLYTVSGNIHAYLKRANMEIPLMASFRSNGFIAQLGVKMQYAFWSQATQRIKDASIDAFYVPYNVHVTDELITGVVSEADRQKKTFTEGAPTMSMLVAARMGYEKKVGDRGLIGIVLYLDYNVWNNFTSPKADLPLIAVAPISNPIDPVPAVNINNAFSAVITGLNPLQIGVSLYYGIEFDHEFYANNRPRKVRSNLRYNPYKLKYQSNKYRPYYSRHRRR